MPSASGRGMRSRLASSMPSPRYPRRAGYRRSFPTTTDRKSTRLNSSHTEIYTLSLHDALPIYAFRKWSRDAEQIGLKYAVTQVSEAGWLQKIIPHNHRSEEHTSELQSHRDLHSFPTRRSSDLCLPQVVAGCGADWPQVCRHPGIRGGLATEDHSPQP